jgi:hypothetical protein
MSKSTASRTRSSALQLHSKTRVTQVVRAHTMDRPTTYAVENFQVDIRKMLKLRAT